MSKAAPRIGNPWPGSPSTAALPTWTSSNRTSAMLSRCSVRIGNGLTSMPSVDGSTRKMVTPRCRRDGSIVAATRKMPASAACEMNTLLPVNRQPPSTGVARVRMAARSVPPLGSVRQADARIAPLASGGSHRWRCSGVPDRRIEPPTSELATDTADATTQSTRASSSQTTP